MSSRTKLGALLALIAAIGLLGIVGLNATPASAFPVAFGPGNAATLTPGVTSGNQSVTYTDEGLAPVQSAVLSTTAPAGGSLLIMSCTVSTNTDGVVTFTVGGTTCSVADDTDTIVETITITYTLLCSGTGAGTVTLTHGTVITQTVNCGAVAGAVAGPNACQTGGTTGAASATVISVCKIDQRGNLLSATFQLLGPNFFAEMLTQDSGPGTSSSARANPCFTNWACTRIFPAPPSTGAVTLGIGALPAGTYTLTEVTAPSGCTQIQIINGLGQLMPPGAPISITIPAASAAANTFTFTNSCALPGGASAAASQVVAVIGGSTFGLTNRNNVEIAPAPGSDDDARIDIRVRDSNNVTIPGAHVLVTTDKGRLVGRQDFTGATIAGFDVIEPAAPSFGTPDSGDPCDIGIGISATTLTGATFANPFLTAGSQQQQDLFTNSDGIASVCLLVNDAFAPGITPGRATITVIIENPNPFFGFFPGAANILLTGTVTVVGPPASIRVTASPTSLICGEKATITATITDAIGQNVSDHTRVELVSNFGSTIGGTGATLGFPGTGPVNPLSSSAAETFSGVATAFLLTSQEHVGPYEVVVTSGGSTGGTFLPGGFVGNIQQTIPGTTGTIIVAGTPVVLTPVTGTTLTFPIFGPPDVIGSAGVFSTAPVSAQVTVTCSLGGAVPAAPAAPAPSVSAPRTGEGIRPPNTGDAGLASSSSSSLAFAIAGVAVFALAGVATLKVVRR